MKEEDIIHEMEHAIIKCKNDKLKESIQCKLINEVLDEHKSYVWMQLVLIERSIWEWIIKDDMEWINKYAAKYADIVKNKGICHLEDIEQLLYS